MKRSLRCVILAAIAIPLLTTTILATDFQINVGGATMGSSSLVYNKDKRVMVPIKNIASNLGYTTSYDKRTNTVNMSSITGSKISLTNGQRYAVKGSQTVKLPAATLQKNGTSYMSFAGIRQVFDSEITWNTDTRTIFISNTKQAQDQTAQQLPQVQPQVQKGSYTKYGVIGYKEEQLSNNQALAEKAKQINDSEVVLAKGGKVVQSIKDIGVFLLTDISQSTLDSIDEIIVFDHTSKIAYTTKGGK